MAKRRKTKKTAQKQSTANGLNKSLPELPRETGPPGAFTPSSELDTPPEKYSDPISDMTSRQRPARLRKEPSAGNRRDGSPSSSDEKQIEKGLLLRDRYERTKNLLKGIENLTLPPSTYRGNRMSTISKNSGLSSAFDGANGDDGLFVPLVLDTNPATGSSPMAGKNREFGADAPISQPPTDSRLPQAKDYFVRKPVTSTGRDLVQETLQETSRSSSTERKQPSSPHIAYQEKGRQPSEHLVDTLRKKKDVANDGSPVPSQSIDTSSNSPSYALAPSNQGDFKLQEVPKSKKAGSRRSSQSKSPSATSPVVDSIRHTPLIDIPGSSSPQRSGLDSNHSSVREVKRQEEGPSVYLPTRGDSNSRPSAERPKRGDSLQNSMKLRKEPPRAEGSGPTTPTAPPGFSHDRSASSVSARDTEPSGPTVNGRSISKPIESPTSRSILDVPSGPPARSSSRPSPGAAPAESFTSPRAAPPPPPTPSGMHKANESTSTAQTDLSTQISPVNLPRYSTGGEFSLEEDMARILRGDEASQPEPGVLRKVSNAVKHGRSFSDRGTRSISGSGKWSTKSPLNGSMDISSPISATSPESREENILLKNQLRRVQERVTQLEAEKTGLQGVMHKSTDMSTLNSEIREKRSTMAFLDTQREIVVRELEVLTDHLKKAKDTNEPLDINSLKSDITKDFGASLQRLKDSFAPQIEELIKKRNDLTNECSQLIAMKDKGFAEYEALSTRNAQLTQHNNELIHSIQDMYKSNRANGQSIDAGRGLANGLGIQIAKDKNDSTTDLRQPVDMQLQNLGADDEASIITPHVVQIPRTKAKPNMWKKGTQGLTKGLRGVRGALAERSAERAQQYNQFEGMPYNQMSTEGLVPKQVESIREPARRNFGNFFGSEKPGNKLQHLKSGHNNSNPSLSQDATASATNLFNTDLSVRCEMEKSHIPSIVSRCIQEIELRGMDVEGIYRKSGGSGQVNQIRMGFEQTNDYDLSDPDLDVNSITSALKQYFRRLPTPLITFDVYDSLLAATQIQDEPQRIQQLKEAITALPEAHQNCLTFLVFHLGRVMDKASVNLVRHFHSSPYYFEDLEANIRLQMTAHNLAVVFAPTIMRPASIELEMSHMAAMRSAVESLLENSKTIFVQA